MADFYDSHVGRIIIAVNGAPIAEIYRLSYTLKTGRKALGGFTVDGDPVGTADGRNEYDIDAECYIKTFDTTIDWPKLTNASIFVTPKSGVGTKRLFGGVFCTEIEDSFDHEKEATRKVKLGALSYTAL